MRNLPKEIIQFWIDSWHESKVLFWAEFTATVASIIASYHFATASPDPNLVFVFLLYLVGSSLLVYTMWKRGAVWMLVLMAWYSAMNIIGLYNVGLPI